VKPNFNSVEVHPQLCDKASSGWCTVTIMTHNQRALSGYLVVTAHAGYEPPIEIATQISTVVHTSVGQIPSGYQTGF